VHPTQTIEIFGNVSTPYGILAIHWHPGKLLRRSSQRNRGELKRKSGSRVERSWPIEGYISETVQDRR